jgi:acetyl esterase/lipase
MNSYYRKRQLSVLTAVVIASAVVLAANADAQVSPVELHDVRYVDNGVADQIMDVYWSTPAASTVLFIHGGSLQQSGERRSSEVYRDVCKPFVAAGISCATMDYRLAPATRWPAMPDDVAAAFAKLRNLVSAHGGDPKKVFLFGHSSGCHLAAIVGTNPVHLKTVGLSPSDIAGIIPMGCTLDRDDAAIRKLTPEIIRAGFMGDGQDIATFGTPELYLAANPSSFIGPHVPRTLVVVAEEERFMPAILEQGARFVRRLLEINRPADIVIVPGRHMKSIAAIGNPGDPTFAAIRKFIEGEIAVAH